MTREYRDPEKWLAPELSLGQKLELEQIKRSIPKMPREVIEAHLLDAVKMSFSYQNIIKGLLKK